jgi:catechol 2,3-dioxygenase-like lactoylglutathione lyase family enzyme
MSRNSHRPASLQRRAILQLSGIVAAVGLRRTALAQGLCEDGYGQPRCPLSREAATAPIPAVFGPTGWKTTALESITFETEDYRQEAAFYIALLGWRLRSDDGQQAVLDIGDWGSAIFRQVPRDAYTVQPPEGCRVVVSSFAFVINQWNANQVAAELQERGMKPIAANSGGFESFFVKDPDGWNLQICNGLGLAHSRRTKANTRLAQAPPFGPTGWRTEWLDHLSFRVSNYKKSASFYSNLLGWVPAYDEGSQSELAIANIGDILVRGGNPFVPSQVVPRKALVDHICFGIAPWDAAGVRAALVSRGLMALPDFHSYHTQTPNGFDLQIASVIRGNRRA